MGIILCAILLILTRGSEDLLAQQDSMAIFFTSIGVLLAALVIRWQMRPAYEAYKAQDAEAKRSNAEQ